MNRAIWRGSWTVRARIVSGLVLFAYALTHFLNLALGLHSSEAMQAVQGWRQAVTRSTPGGIALYGALLVHGGLALWSLARRATLRMPAWEWAQMALGLLIPAMLVVHVTFTRGAHMLYGVEDRFVWVAGLIWNTADGWWQSALLLVVWIHAALGLHFWLRILPAWRRALPLLTALAALIPALALAGFAAEGRRSVARLADPVTREAVMAEVNWIDTDAFVRLLGLSDQGRTIWLLLIGGALAIFLMRRALGMRRAITVTYSEGPRVSSPRGPTLLEISRASGVPHAALCGGRGRCTTCRVVVEAGLDALHPPSEAERRSLAAVGAPPGTRLACQIRPTADLVVWRVFRQDGRRRRAHAGEGRERRLAILFLDIRGFTERSTGQLPYDVVFLLNRFFDAVVPAITGEGGSVDKYLGDGLLALFEAKDEAASARAALSAAAGIGRALDAFNATLASEGAAPIRIGIGVHLGQVVIGEIGAAGRAPRTIIGETVNAASRLEAATKEAGVEALVSAATLAASGIDTAPLALREVTLRGLAAPLPALALPRAAELDALLAAPAAPA